MNIAFPNCRGVLEPQALADDLAALLADDLHGHPANGSVLLPDKTEPYDRVTIVGGQTIEFRQQATGCQISNRLAGDRLVEEYLQPLARLLASFFYEQQELHTLVFAPPHVRPAPGVKIAFALHQFVALAVGTSQARRGYTDVFVNGSFGGLVGCRRGDKPSLVQWLHFETETSGGLRPGFPNS